MSFFHYDTLLDTGTSKEKIGHIVNKKKDLCIKSFNVETGREEFKKIKKWVKKQRNTDFCFVSYKNAYMRSNKKNGIYVSADSNVLSTNNNFRNVNNLDNIFTFYPSLNNYQYDVFNGTMLGDSYIVDPYLKKRNGNGYYFRFCHSIAQQPWFELKCNVFKNVLATTYTDIPRVYIYDNGKTINKKTTLVFNARTGGLWSELRRLWYPNNKKIVPENINLTPIGIAALYMDDGTLEDKRNPIICSDGFDKNSIDVLCYKFSEYGLFPKLIPIQDENSRIVFRNSSRNITEKHNSSNKFFDLIKEYVIPHFQYKLPDEFKGYYNKNLWISSNENERLAFMDEPEVILESINNHNEYVYSIEIEENNNLILNNMIFEGYTENDKSF